MKLNAKHILVLALSIVAVTGVAVYASFRVYSNVAGPVTLNNYANIYQTTISGTSITVYAQIVGNPYAGVTVYLYESPNGNGNPDTNPGDWTYTGLSGTTDGSGYVQITWTAPGNGNYYFIVGYDVP